MITGPENKNPNARVRVEVIWKGQKYDYTTEVLPERATHYTMDREVYKAHIKVRCCLAEVEYPGRDFTSASGPVRDEMARWNGIAVYLSQTPDAWFEFVPPDPARGRHKWYAWFKTRQDELFAVEANPPVGLGTSYAVAVENLLRYVEGKEPIGG